MSKLIDIYDAIEAKTVTTTSGKTPTVYNLDALPKSISTAILPCRLLLPIGNESGDGREGKFVAIGTSMTVDWQINDLMLWQSSQQGLGLEEFAPEIMDYCAKYMDMVRTLKAPTTTDTSLELVSVTPGMYEWPIGSGKWFSGVLCQLTIKEHLHG